MTQAFAIAFGVLGLALVVVAGAAWRDDEGIGITLAVGLPGAAFVYAAGDFIVRAIA